MNSSSFTSKLFPYRKNTKHVKKHAFELESVDELVRYYKWTYDLCPPKVELDEYRFKEDLNKRRLRDAETLIHAALGSKAKTILEIGTAEGGTTDLLSSLAPNATIHTMNIPPEEIKSGEGGVYVTEAYAKDQIGHIYKTNGRENVRQILCNSANWEPDISNVDFAFIDGCHDAKFVYNDTKKILPIMSSGGYILWHDFNPNAAKHFKWVRDVCMGIDRLLREKIIKGEVLYVKNSWIGVYKVP